MHRNHGPDFCKLFRHKISTRLHQEVLQKSLSLKIYCPQSVYMSLHRKKVICVVLLVKIPLEKGTNIRLPMLQTVLLFCSLMSLLLMSTT